MACCRQARQLGVRAGMPLAEVEILNKQSSRALRLEDYQPAQDKQALQGLAVWCEQFSPIVGLEEAEHPASLLLDITGLAPLYGSEATLRGLVVNAFQERGYEARAAVANTIGAAWALAHFASDPVTEELADLPVESLRLEAEAVETLRQLGVESVDALLLLPRHGLATRLGPKVLQRMDQALGRQAEVIVAQRPIPCFEATWELEHPTDRRDVMEEVLSELTKLVAKELAEHDHAAVQVEAVLRSGQSVRRLPVSLFQPTNQSAHLLELFLLRLEAVHMQAPIEHVRVTAVTTVRMRGDQQTLWEEMGGRREIASFVDRLASRLGRANVFGVSSQAGALPENAYRQTELTIHSRRKTKVQGPPLPRPLWLANPEPLRQVAGAPSSDPPDRFLFQSALHHIRHAWGPERIETGWWKGRSIRRDYYRVETDQGYRFWIFRRISDGSWFLHGCFE